MPTLAGLRRRGVHPRGDPRLLRAHRRLEAKQRRRRGAARARRSARPPTRAARRVMGVVRPLRSRPPRELPEGVSKTPRAPLVHRTTTLAPKAVGRCPSAAYLYIDHDDFAETPPKGWFRLTPPGGEVRLRHACIIRCERVVKDGNAASSSELRCTWDPESRGGNAKDGRKVEEGTLHWVSEAHAVPAEVGSTIGSSRRSVPVRGPPPRAARGRLLGDINPDSLTIERAAPGGAGACVGEGRRERTVRARRLLLPRSDSRPGALI